jgi:hypothetical protein
MAFFMFAKWWKFTTKTKPLVTSSIFIFKFQKYWIRFMMILKIELKCIQTNLMLDLFMCVRLKLLELIFNFYLLWVTFFFSNFQSHFFGKFFVVYIFFPTKLAKLRKFETKKTCWLR